MYLAIRPVLGCLGGARRTVEVTGWLTLDVGATCPDEPDIDALVFRCAASDTACDTGDIVVDGCEGRLASQISGPGGVTCNYDLTCEAPGGGGLFAG